MFFDVIWSHINKYEKTTNNEYDFCLIYLMVLQSPDGYKIKKEG